METPPPNTLGRDVFLFGVTQNGQLLPYGSNGAVLKYCNDLQPNNKECYTQLKEATHWSVLFNNSCTEVGNGICCAARIIENGWKMDY